MEFLSKQDVRDMKSTYKAWIRFTAQMVQHGFVSENPVSIPLSVSRMSSPNVHNLLNRVLVLTSSQKDFRDMRLNIHCSRYSFIISFR